MRWPWSACEQLGIAKSRLCQLRFSWLARRDSFCPKPSGGSHRALWPASVVAFLELFLPLSRPPNFQLVADELMRLHGFVRARSSVEAYLKKHLPHLLPIPPPRVRSYRRFRRAYIGELWQHDSSISKRHLATHFSRFYSVIPFPVLFRRRQRWE